MPKTYIENLHNEDGGTVNIHQAPHIIPKVLTKQTGLANDLDFIGRKDELEKVDELLNQNATLLLLNGIGGIGKSTLASYYLNQNKDNFDYYGFVQVNEDIKLSLASAFSTSLDLKSEKIDDLFAEIMNKLQNLEGKKLLIIDDVKEMDNQLDEMNTLMTLKNNGFQILFTSRETKEYIPQYFLDIMSVEDARELFLKHYATDEMEKVDKILEYLDYHTLFIEITAKTLSKRKNTLSLDIAIEKFDNGEFTVVKRNKSESFNKFLKNFSYDSAMLTQKKTLLFLKKISILPSIEISFEDLYKFLVCEDKERLEGFLIELVDNGWLIESEHAYKFHQVLKEFMFDNYLPLFEEIEVQVDYLIEIMGNTDDAQVVVNNKHNIVYFESLVALWNILRIENEKMGDFFNRFGLIYKYLALYQKAKPISVNALKIFQKVFGEKHSETATLYNNLASLYDLMKEYQKSEPLYLKALNIWEKGGTNHFKVSVSYNNLAELYRLTGKYQKAEPFYFKALKIRKEVLGEENTYTATSYNNLGSLYDLMQEYQKAEPLYLKALDLWEKVLEEEHPNIAQACANLGAFYYNKGDLKKAYPYAKKAFKIWSKILPKSHPNLMNIKMGLESIESNLNL